jgi:hypothetical protein
MKRTPRATGWGALVGAALMTTALPSLTATPAAAQSVEEAIDRALTAAPPRMADDATVIRWNADHTYETLREGTNAWVCYDRTDQPRRAPFDVQCTVMGNLPRVAQNLRFRMESEDRDGENALIEAAEADGTRVLPVYGSLWIAARGQDQASATTHTTIAVPGATSETTGLPEDGSAGGAWIMAAGTSSAHIMIPGS